MLKGKEVFSYLFVLCIPLIISCNGGGKKDSANKQPSPPGYDLSTNSQIKLPPELDEVSGIYYYPKDTSVFCINDEKGILYKVFLDQGKRIIKWHFAKSGDFEDIVLLDSNFYVLQSSGNLMRLRFFKGDSLMLDTLELPLKGKNEFEILYYDNTNKQMVLVCKECEQDQKNKVSAIAFDPVTNKTSTAYVLQEATIEEKLGEKGRFKPSAAAIHPLTNQLYIISSVNKALVISDLQGNVQSVYRIDPKKFKQPEGMTFTPTGDLIISNESADKGAANILFFKYKQTGT
jgi:uncharacterized protein YjiK